MNLKKNLIQVAQRLTIVSTMEVKIRFKRFIYHRNLGAVSLEQLGQLLFIYLFELDSKDALFTISKE